MIYYGDKTTELTKEELLEQARIMAYKLHVIEFYTEKVLIDEWEAGETIEMIDVILEMSEEDASEFLGDH